jgi:hypothetical protein
VIKNVKHDGNCYIVNEEAVCHIGDSSMVIYAISARVDPDFTSVSHIQNIGDAGDAMGDGRCGICQPNFMHYSIITRAWNFHHFSPGDAAYLASTSPNISL